MRLQPIATALLIGSFISFSTTCGEVRFGGLAASPSHAAAAAQPDQMPTSALSATTTSAPLTVTSIQAGSRRTSLLGGGGPG